MPVKTVQPVSLVVTADDLRIDMKRLDMELEMQAMKFYAASMSHVEAVGEMELARDERQVTEAELYLRGRGELEKPTEALIRSWVQGQTAFLEAEQKYKIQKMKADEAQALRQAMEQRSHALHDLVRLQTTSYGLEQG